MKRLSLIASALAVLGLTACERDLEEVSEKCYHPAYRTMDK